MPPRKIAAHPRPRGRAETLARGLASEILDGHRPVGSLLPPESALAEQHGASIAVIRAALKRLEELGLIARQRGGPARVVSGEVRASYSITAPLRGGDDAGGSYAGPTAVSVERQRTVQADAELAMLLAVREGSRWLCVSGPRMFDDPTLGTVSWMDAWLDSDAASIGSLAPLSISAIESLTGGQVADIIEEFAAGPLTPSQARYLRARGGAPALHVTRRYLRANGSLLAAVRDIHPADRVSVSVRLGGA